MKLRNLLITVAILLSVSSLLVSVGSVMYPYDDETTEAVSTGYTGKVDFSVYSSCNVKVSTVGFDDPDSEILYLSNEGGSFTFRNAEFLYITTNSGSGFTVEEILDDDSLVTYENVAKISDTRYVITLLSDLNLKIVLD